MTTLQNQINDYITDFKQRVPEEKQQIMRQATQNLADSDIVANAPKLGDKLANFTLSNQNGREQSLSNLLANGPVVITLYRGGWCPYCNLELKAFQAILPEIKAAGATLVAVTPELPDMSLTTTEKNELGFEVLTDVNADWARAQGLVFTLPDELRPIYAKFDLEKYNGSGQFGLPLAATYVVAQDGTIASAFVDADYTKRQEPSEILPVLQSLTSTEA